jgi:hypothetical protein
MTPEGAGPAGADRHLCPLCGRPNRCAMAEASRTECWCVGAAFSADLLGRAATSAGEARCICAHCASGTAPPSPATTSDMR